MDWSIVINEMTNLAVAFIAAFIFARLFFTKKKQRKHIIVYGTLAEYVGKYLLDYYGLLAMPPGKWSFVINWLKIILITGFFVFMYYEITQTLSKDRS